MFLNELERMQGCPTALLPTKVPCALLGDEKKKLSKLWAVLNQVKVRTGSKGKEHFSSEAV